MDAATLTRDLGGKWHRRYGCAPCPVCQPERRKGQNALTLADGRDGRLLLDCKKSGCSFADILATTGITRGSYTPPDPATLAQRDRGPRRRGGRQAAQRGVANRARGRGMTGFAFDAKAALERAQNRQTRPNRPNRRASGGAGLGGLGRLGTVRASDPEMTPDELARDAFEERAAIREYEAGQDRAEAERAAWAEASSAAGVTSLDAWRAAADDVTNPDTWK